MMVNAITIAVNSINRNDSYRKNGKWILKSVQDFPPVMWQHTYNVPLAWS